MADQVNSSRPGSMSAPARPSDRVDAGRWWDVAEASSDAVASEAAFVGRYCRGKIFLFVPNVCDAECRFCYVSPARVSTARLSAGVLRRTVDLMAELRHCGLREVRITGGEPFVFENLVDLVTALRTADLDYTVLTNGIRLPRAVPWLLATRPLKITVSVHSLRRADQVFGRPVMIEQTVAAIAALAAAGIGVSATVVCLPDVIAEIPETLARLYRAGVREYKLIHANDSRYRVGIETFRAVAERAREALPPDSRLRFSDTAETSCLLTRQGELSVALPRFEWSSCCATVGETSLGTATTRREFGRVTLALREQLSGIIGLPCSNQGFCPIALTELEK
ncbi:radical SAM protein [Micromonospora zhanjiangensis]|uniref:Radical SAM protein n=2 Tax=Micromonospora zhanjiangensis TaxID=1522057 RepID=A0ABV8KS44_9ACTN